METRKAALDVRPSILNVRKTASFQASKTNRNTYLLIVSGTGSKPMDFTMVIYPRKTAPIFVACAMIFAVTVSMSLSVRVSVLGDNVTSSARDL